MISIIIPLYNNSDIINSCFTVVVKYATRHPEITEIIAIDDASTDGTPQIIRQKFPLVILLINKKNLGFGKTCNLGIASAKNEIIILLNSDVTIASNIAPLVVDSFNKDKNLFQISFFSHTETGAKMEGQKRAVWKTGIIKTRNNFDNDYEDKLYDTLYACAGHCALSRSKFLEVGGFSPVFVPFYWEDVDLSYVAQKRGWNVVFDPRCTVIHKHKGSIRTAYQKKFIDKIQTRNKILFLWKNMTDPWVLVRHCVGMLVRVLTSWISGDFIFYKAFFEALRKMDVLIKEKQRCKKKFIVSDFKLFRKGWGQ